MPAQREQSRIARRVRQDGDGEHADDRRARPRPDGIFLGYETTEAEATIVAIVGESGATGGRGGG